MQDRTPKPRSTVDCAATTGFCSGLSRTAGLLLLVITAVAISGCGFKLRGTLADARHLPITFIHSERGSTLSIELHKVFHQAGVRLVSQRELAGWVLTLSDEQRQRRVLSVGSTGKVQEFELLYQVNYMLEDSDGRVIIDAQPLSLLRDYTYSGIDVLAKDDEEAVLYQGMQQQAAEIILRRLLLHQKKAAVRANPGNPGEKPGGAL